MSSFHSPSSLAAGSWSLRGSGGGGGGSHSASGISLGRLDHSEDDMLQQQLGAQLAQYRKEMASLQERASGIVHENASLREEVANYRSISATTRSDSTRFTGGVFGSGAASSKTALRSSRRPGTEVKAKTSPREVFPDASAHAIPTDHRLAQLASPTTSPTLQRARRFEGAAVSTAQEQRSPASRRAQPAARPNINEDEDGSLECTELQSSLAATPSPGQRQGGGQRMAYLELELARCRKEKERLEQNLDDTNYQLTCRLKDVLQLETRLSVQDENNKKREAEIKADIPELCVSCGHRKALLPQPLSAEDKTTIHGLERERDEALAWLSSLRERLAERREKELSTDQHIQSLTGHVKVFTEENQQLKREVSQLRTLLRNAETNSAAQLEKLNNEHSSLAKSLQADWEAERGQLAGEAQQSRHTIMRSKEDMISLRREKDRLESELNSLQQHHAMDTQHWEKRVTQLETDQKEQGAVHRKQMSERDTVSKQLVAGNERLRRELAELKIHTASCNTELESMEETLQESQNRCTQLETMHTKCKQELLGAQLKHKHDAQMRETEFAHQQAEWQRQLDDANLKYSYAVKQHGAAERDLQQKLEEERSICQHWKNQCREVTDAMRVDIDKFRSRSASNKAAAAALADERDAMARDAAMLEAELKKQRKLCRKLQDSLTQTEQESAHWKTQVQGLLQKQCELMHERRKLSRRLDKYLSAQPAGRNALSPSPLHMSVDASQHMLGEVASDYATADIGLAGGYANDVDHRMHTRDS
ncbi:serologically defined colon cancer antigen 8 homolog [Sycon ciliatum]|uniref:serologically defined colon cancer antigen 8 homolog n=1 Tax=Sycon ciliatum TaxID=27933 RepID=UPI0031F6B2F6